MKKRFVKLMAAITCATILTTTSVVSFAGESSYDYIYDFWGDVQDSPDFYEVSRVFTASDLGLETNFKSPSGLYASGNSLYICDTGNNRIVEVERVSSQELKVVRIIDSFKGPVDTVTFSAPEDIAISSEGNIFITDGGNHRILKLDSELNYIMHFEKPVDNTLDPDLSFQPKKLVVDDAERVYCIATGINKGLIKYEPDGTFSGFVGATKVTYNFMDYLWKKFATQAQRAKMESFVPTEYDNIYLDHEGFIYAVTSAPDKEDIRSGDADVIRKLNLMGNDIIVRNGEWFLIGDLYFGNGGGYEGPSRLTDVTVMENDIYMVLDRNRGRVFAYDDQGNMVFAFGGNGNMDGYFRKPAGIEHIGHELYVLDNIDCAITTFVPTEFGKHVYRAIETFDEGDYETSERAWREAAKLNGNYDLAYIGIGRALLRQKRFREAMDYFELKYDYINYSKAYKQFRKEWVEENIVLIVVVILLIFLVPMGIGKVRSVKREIDEDKDGLFK